ncbi:hypothetical protein MCOR34_006922 [Pyricularia oryzae]|uniref:Uncharacterized protein n=1 Tax=Pyricularia oryzae TaxID=318829 RepID=A0A4P7NLX8_PYROR|nr:hypothetical protein MCOR01_007978 [Pyricularia oryzae]KAI6309193.1 hypothetical protein MCOR34_006922 [Pyricularia oryzae]KAI6405211.1 hypothetical protein MCOR20_006641 [Pyricularia oryzae]KAI6504106.1 hypothetical protein MCOR13_004948 [Pyricularia oryzae]QBZ63201.1 hypothetical protein PoMZ_12098 [Pyricularia oryzae]
MLCTAGSRRTRLIVLTTFLVIVTLYLGFNLEDGSNPYDLGSYTDLVHGGGGTRPSSSGEGVTSQSPQSQSQSAPSVRPPSCLKFEDLLSSRPGPYSNGKRKFPLVRPPPECRTFRLPSLESLLERMKGVIKDPDLYRLFENNYPNTLDTMIKWKGYAREPAAPTAMADGDQEQQPEVGAQLGPETDEELTYVITGDIDAMWLRDSASQVYSYLPLLEADKSPDSLASLWRGVINLHSRYIITSPYCHSFQPPAESGIPPTRNGAFEHNNPQPGYDPRLVYDCKWELDSLASFLQISVGYHQRTGDLAFFGRYQWAQAVRAAVDAAAAMTLGTYAADGKTEKSAWTFMGWTNRGTETLTNDGMGNPTRANGMVRTAFRPSDDATIFQLLVPANMMFAKYLEEASLIPEALSSTTDRAAAAGTKRDEGLVRLAADMRALAKGIREGIARDAVVRHRRFGDMFAYEVDGFGGANLMDDANVPSLLAMPLWNFSQRGWGGGGGGSVVGAANATWDPLAEELAINRIYLNTRRFVLSDANPYYAKGPVISAVGGPHIGPGRAWPMAAIVAGMTAYDVAAMRRLGFWNATGISRKTKDDEVEAWLQDEVAGQLRMVLDSTSGTGVVHESVNSWDEGLWTRSWFGWASGLLGELILRIEGYEKRLPPNGKGLLSRSWQ